MIDSIKHIIDYISAPTISFTLITVLFPFIFPPTDWFDKINRKLRIYKLWTNTGGIIQFALVTSFFVLGYKDSNFQIKKPGTECQPTNQRPAVSIVAAH